MLAHKISLPQATPSQYACWVKRYVRGGGTDGGIFRTLLISTPLSAPDANRNDIAAENGNTQMGIWRSHAGR